MHSAYYTLLHITQLIHQKTIDHGKLVELLKKIIDAHPDQNDKFSSDSDLKIQAEMAIKNLDQVGNLLKKWLDVAFSTYNLIHWTRKLQPLIDVTINELKAYDPAQPLTCREILTEDRKLFWLRAKYNNGDTHAEMINIMADAYSIALLAHQASKYETNLDHANQLKWTIVRPEVNPGRCIRDLKNANEEDYRTILSKYKSTSLNYLRHIKRKLKPLFQEVSTYVDTSLSEC